MLGLSYITRFAGMDATLGFAFASTGPLYPFFAPLLGWLGVFLTGTDAGSNALFGSLQQITARKVAGFLALTYDQAQVLICTSNSTGGVMGKMIDAQSIVVATAATNQQLLEIMLAQDFQDLTGQVIKKITEIVYVIEQQLLGVLVENIAPERREQFAATAAALVAETSPTGSPEGLLNGPQINPEGKADVMQDQSQVDDLLASYDVPVWSAGASATKRD